MGWASGLILGDLVYAWQNRFPPGSDVSAGTYTCTNCGDELTVGSTKNLPPRPSCHNGHYHTVRGGDAAEDPDPDRQS